MKICAYSDNSSEALGNGTALLGCVGRCEALFKSTGIAKNTNLVVKFSHFSGYFGKENEEFEKLSMTFPNKKVAQSVS